MNSNINSSGLYDVNSYNLIATNATILSTLNVSGTTTFSNNVGIGINNTTNMLKIYNPLYTTPLLVLDAGIQNLPRNQNPRAIGKPLLGLGNKAWTDIGDYYGIGFGWHAGGVNDCYCGEIGLIITNTSNGEYGDLVFSTRSTNNWYTPATERMRITPTGNVTIGLNINNTTYKLNVDGSVNATSYYYNGSLIDFNSLSTNSTLSISNLNATSTTIFNNLNSLSTNSILSINNLNSTSNSIFNNLNSLSTNSTLSINNLNSTSNTIFNNLNSLSTNSTIKVGTRV